METTKVTGLIQILKKDKKGVQLDDGKWYSNNFLPDNKLITAGKGDKVELTLNSKGFLMECKVLEKSLIQEKSGNTIDENARLRRELDAKSKALELACLKTNLTPEGHIQIAQIYLKFLGETLPKVEEVKTEKIDLKGSQNGSII